MYKRCPPKRSSQTSSFVFGDWPGVRFLGNFSKTLRLPRHDKRPPPWFSFCRETTMGNGGSTVWMIRIHLFMEDNPEIWKFLHVVKLHNDFLCGLLIQWSSKVNSFWIVVQFWIQKGQLWWYFLFLSPSPKSAYLQTVQPNNTPHPATVTHQDYSIFRLGKPNPNNLHLPRLHPGWGVDPSCVDHQKSIWATQNLPTFHYTDPNNGWLKIGI